MIVAPPARPRSTEESLLPLINIVFLLLIFFMLTGVLTQKPLFELTPPRTADTEESTSLQDKVLEVRADGRLGFAGQSIERDDLEQALADWPDGKTLQVRADADTRAESVAELLATLRHAGIGRVDLLTQHEQP